LLANSTEISLALRQIEEQEIFTAKLQRQLKNTDAELSKAMESNDRLGAMVGDLQEQVREREKELTDYVSKIQNLRSICFDKREIKIT